VSSTCDGEDEESPGKASTGVEVLRVAGNGMAAESFRWRRLCEGGGGTGRARVRKEKKGEAGARPWL
jgi:hypothetical protein